ncbi:TetR family transcriptional regulator (plasmid) [Embleya sp. NBC_00888]|uniref:TetR/AcrR family transcriptional regulator n=1 Tax=Embleya sp. NBC_00888 TaxID=2975960 RepID=UPI002F90F045|nr:TetR family transcriptional regulator [Embleya sp. NBC_00888]
MADVEANSAKRVRRSPRPEERGKAAADSRARILDAALAEFSAKGYAGARTAGIAARAGVNQQLIAYYFGGKQGLVDELRARWRERRDAIAAEEAGFEQGFAAMMDATLDDPQRSRMVVWQALGDGPDDARALSDEWRATLTDAVERMRSRQESGEVTDEFDPEFAVLLGFVLSFAPIALPQVVEGIYGIDPLSAEYRERVRAQLMKILVPPRAGAGDGEEEGAT